MILHRLAMTNFRSFQRAVLEFSAGQNYIFGGNWQGKSSIVDAIGFAFFGAEILPRRLAGAPVKAEHLLNEQGGRGSVELTFTKAGQEYTLHRSLPGGAVTLASRGRAISAGVRRVRDHLRDHFEMDAKLFQNIFYADQDELRKSLDFTPGERQSFIERLLGMDLWRERAAGIHRLRDQAVEFLGDLQSGRLGAFLDELENLSTQVEEERNELADLEQTIAETKQLAPRNVTALRRKEQASTDSIQEQMNAKVRLATEVERDEAIIAALKRGKCPTCTQPVPAPLARARLAALRASLKEMKAQLRRVGKELEALEQAHEEADYDEAFTVYEDLAGLRGEHKRLANSLKKNAARERELRKQAKVFGKKPQQVARARAEITFLEQLEAAVHEYRRELRGRAVGQLQQAMNQFLARFHDGDNDVSVVLDADLAVKTRLHGREVPIFNLSGAAKDILALALRYGLLRIAARHVDFIVLDEPTRHMDAANCQRLKGLFDELSDHQLIVVTVHQEFGQARGRHFTVSKNDQLCSTIATRT